MINILLIDDDHYEHKMMEAFTKICVKDKAYAKKRFVLDGAHSIENALQLLEVNKYDYIFLDDRLTPEGSVLETLPLIQGMLHNAKVFVISACTSAGYLKDHRDLGVDAVINKLDLSESIRQGLLAA